MTDLAVPPPGGLGPRRPGPAHLPAADLAARLAEADGLLVTSPERSLHLAFRARLDAARARDTRHEALALTLMGYAQYLLGRLPEAQGHFGEAAELARPLAPDAVHARILNGQALCFMRLGNAGQALECHMQALKLSESLGDDRSRARAMNNIGVMMLDLREFEEALRYIEDARTIAGTLGLTEIHFSTSINLAHTLQELGRHAEALELNRATLPDVREAGLREREALLNSNLSQNLLGLGQHTLALEHSDAALALREAVSDPENLCRLLVARGRILTALHRGEEAHAALEDALALARTHSILRSESEARWALAALLDRQGAHREAFEQLRLRDAAERQLMREMLERRTQRMTAQLQLERVEQRAREIEQRRKELQDANNALLITQQSLQYYVQHDALTGLKNRPAFENDLQRALGAVTGLPGQAPGQQVSLIFIDLDHFKVVNDTLGHPVGDELLRQVARRLSAALPPGGVVARQGGDEFTVLLTHGPGQPDGMTLAAQLQGLLSEPFDLAGQPLVLTTSIGVAVAPQDGHDVVTLYKNADLAMYEAKTDRNDLRRYTPALSEAAHQRLTIVQELRSAVQSGELLLHYQPIVDARTLTPVKLEALMRWQHPVRGLLSADRFIRVLEHSELGYGATLWVLRRALTDLKLWRRRWPQLQVSVNVSPRDLARTDMAAHLRAILDDVGLPASALELEMTEYAALSDVSWRPYTALLEEGLGVAIDDFGTGYSSMSRLAHTPARTLKIDRSLIQRLSPEPEDADRSGQIVRTLITFAHTYGLTTVAEGVEEDWQLALLGSWYCDLIQGYLVARPMAAAPLGEFLNDLLEP